MKGKKQINIRFSNASEKNKFQAKIANFMDNKKIKTKNEAYKTALAFGLKEKQEFSEDSNLVVIELLQEINERLKIAEPELRLLYWGFLTKGVLPKDKMEAINLSNLKLPGPLRKAMNEKDI